LEQFNAEVLLVQADVSSETQCNAMIEKVMSTFKRIDVLVNNAGIVFDKEFEERTVEDWKRTLDVNLI
jgi:NAD(P)-dependent dehydrogenase (short-subunit alcohol dehydrogenase family)